MRSLEAALWAFYKSSDFREGCLMAANLGDDADTTEAVYGQLAGAFYGESGIPKHWLDKLAMPDKIISFADQLCALSQQSSGNIVAPGSHGFEAGVHKAAEDIAMPVPFDRPYWVVPGKFLAGAYPGDLVPEEADKKLRSFFDAGIRCFVDLTFPDETNVFRQSLVPYRELAEKIAAGQFKITYRRMPIIDLDVPSFAEMKGLRLIFRKNLHATRSG